MAIRCGTDLIDIQRVEDALKNERFIKRIFTGREIAYCESRGKSRCRSYAARFAGKEAAAKALGTGIAEGITFKDIEIVNDEKNAPYVILTGQALNIFTGLSARSIAISLTHTDTMAAAFCIIEI